MLPVGLFETKKKKKEKFELVNLFVIYDRAQNMHHLGRLSFRFITSDI